MVIKHTVEGYEEYLKITKELETKKVIFYVLFTGSLKEDTGESWCSDCVKAEPSVEKVVSKLPDTVHFVKVYVGGREYFKDPNCPFRKDKKAHVTTIPTIIRWDGPQRLEGTDFNNVEVISMAFEDE